jgi:hypothetical protein
METNRKINGLIFCEDTKFKGRKFVRSVFYGAAAAAAVLSDDRKSYERSPEIINHVNKEAQ